MRISVLVEDDLGHKFQGEAVLQPQRKASAAPRQRSTSSHSASSGKPPKPKHALKMLYEKGVFKTDQTFGAIEVELGRLEYNFPKPTLMMALGSVPFLTRRGAKGSYRWVQKYKPGA